MKNVKHKTNINMKHIQTKTQTNINKHIPTERFPTFSVISFVSFSFSASFAFSSICFNFSSTFFSVSEGSIPFCFKISSRGFASPNGFLMCVCVCVCVYVCLLCGVCVCVYVYVCVFLSYDFFFGGSACLSVFGDVVSLFFKKQNE